MACVHVLFIRQGKVLAEAAAISQSAWRYGAEPGGGNLRRLVSSTSQTAAHDPATLLLYFNLSDNELLADSLQNWRDARLMFKANLAAIGRVIRAARTNAATALTSKLSQQLYASRATDRACQRVEIAGSETDGVL
ncbi:hypothetical protein ACNKHV_12040 [Shigella flexneri]